MHSQNAEAISAHDPEAIAEARERLIIARLFVDAARVIGREYFPEWQFGNRLETLYVGLCVAIGHLEGQPFSISKLSAYLDASRSNITRRLEALAERPDRPIIRRGRKYYLNLERLNRQSAMAAHTAIVRPITEAAAKLTDLDPTARLALERDQLPPKR